MNGKHQNNTHNSQSSSSLSSSSTAASIIDLSKYSNNMVQPARAHNNHHHHSTPTNTKPGFLETLSPSLQFLVLGCGVFFFFGVHNILQEAMMKIDGFEYGVMLGYMEVVGVTVCSFFERTCIQKETGRVAPLSAYPLLTFCLLSSSALSNQALNYINFPTKVVFRSCKLIPTMIVASFLNRKVFASVEYACAVAVSAGLVLFAAADWRLTPSFNPIGILLVTLSVCADAILPNAQERLFRLGSSRLEVTLYTNFFTFCCMTVSTYYSGDLQGIIRHAYSNHQLALYMAVYTTIAYFAISMHMTVVKRFGGVAAVVLATARKGMTLVLSFVLFPKAFSWFYVFGALLVLGGLLISSLWKIHQKQQQQKQPRGGVPHETIGLHRKLSDARGMNGDIDDDEEDDLEHGVKATEMKSLLATTNGETTRRTSLSTATSSPEAHHRTNVHHSNSQ